MQSDYARLYASYEKYKNFHDDVLEIVMHSGVVLREPRYNYKESLTKTLDKIEKI